MVNTWLAPPAREASRVNVVSRPLLPGVVAGLGSVRIRHTDICMYAGILLGGKPMASLCGGRQLLWDAKTRKELRRIPKNACTRSMIGNT